MSFRKALLGISCIISTLAFMSCATSVVGGISESDVQSNKNPVNVDDAIPSQDTFRFINPQGVNDTILAMEAQGDKLYFGGRFSMKIMVTTLTGAAVSAFKPPVINGSVTRIKVQPDGKILIAGDFPERVRRLNPNGSLDGGFAPPLINGTVLDLDLLPNGQMLVSGTMTQRILRLNANGSVDTTLVTPFPDSNISRVEVLPNGQILIVGSSGTLANRMVRISGVNGALDNTFTTPSVRFLTSLQALPDGRLLMSNDARVLRLNPNGSIDTSFVYDPNVASEYLVNSAFAASDGKVVIADSLRGVARLNANGSNDTTFTRQTMRLDLITLLPDGGIVMSGYSDDTLSPLRKKLLPSGAIDNNFDDGTTRYGFRKAHIQNDGKILVVGSVWTDFDAKTLFRLNANGTPDSTFNISEAPRFVDHVKVANSEKIIAASSGIMVRLNNNGTLDPTFSARTLENSISALEVQPDDKVLYATIANALVRVNANGSTDTSFTPPAMVSQVLSIYVEPSGKIILGGSALGDFLRLNPNGTRDNTFTPIPGVYRSINAIIPCAGGKILIHEGPVRNVNNFSVQDGKVHRLNGDGSVDSTFAPSVILPTNAKVTVLPNDSVFIAGSSRALLLKSDGAVDMSWNLGQSGFYGEMSFGFAIYLPELANVPEGILIGGKFMSYNDQYVRDLIRIDMKGSLN